MAWYLPTRCPVLWEELRRRMRGGRGQLVLLLFNVLLVLLLLLVLATQGPDGNTRGWSVFGDLLWNVFLISQLIAMLLITPGLAAGAISTEREKGTLDLLFLSPMSTIALVTGKVLGALGQLLVMVLSGLPVVAVVFIYGGVSPAEMVSGYLLILITGIFYASLGFLASCLFRRTTAAVVWAYGFMLIVLLGLPAMGLIVSLLNPSFFFLMNGSFWAITANPLMIYYMMVAPDLSAPGLSLWQPLMTMTGETLAILAGCAVIIRRQRGAVTLITHRISLDIARRNSRLPAAEPAVPNPE